MGRPKKVKPTVDLPTDAIESEIPAAQEHTSHDLVIREIQLEAPTEEILRQVATERDLFVLQQALAQEGSKGGRQSVMSAIEARATELRRHGDGAEGPDYDIPGYKMKHPDDPLFETRKAHDSRNFINHDMGEGSEAKQRLTKEQRMVGRLEVEEAKRRMNTAGELFEVIDRTKNGAMLFKWGHVMPPQKEIKDDTGKVTVKFRPSLVFLKYCPRCGKVNRPERGQFGVCDHCELDIKPYVKTDFANNPGKYKGIQLA